VKRAAACLVLAGLALALPPVAARASRAAQSRTTLARPAPGPTDDAQTTSARTGPGVGKPATHDEFATRGWKGVAFVLLSLVLIGWILRARARDPKLPPEDAPDD
jgi:hypothetical protein